MRASVSLALGLALTGLSAGAADPAPAAPAAASAPIVREAVITGIHSERQLLAVMEHVGRMDGLLAVERVALDRKTGEGLIRLTMQPRAESYWRAFLEDMPKARLTDAAAGEPSSRYPQWFDPEEHAVVRVSLRGVADDAQRLAIQRLLQEVKGVRAVHVRDRDERAGTVTFEFLFEADLTSGLTSWFSALDALRGATSPASVVIFRP